MNFNGATPMQAVDFNSDMGEGFGPWTIGDGVDSDCDGLDCEADEPCSSP